MNYKIGILVSGIQDEFTHKLCTGMMRRANLLGVNIVIIPGKYINRDEKNPKLRYEFQYNTVFDIVNRKNIDGLVIAADCIGCFAKEKAIRNFLKKYEGIPTVLAASKCPGYTSVNFDNKSGLDSALAYLIEKLGYTRICMVGAPQNISDAYERKQVYLEALKNHGIEFEERFFVEGDQTHTSVDAFRKILDDNPDAQVIVCQNDETARGLYIEMQSRGLIPGKDIDVLGFDNSEWAESAFPALSSISADAISVGEESISLIVKKLNGEEIEDVNIPTRFIRRESIKSQSATQEDGKPSWTMEEDFQFLFYRCANMLDAAAYEASCKQFVNTCVLARDYVMGKTDSLSLDIFDEFYNNEHLQYLDVGRYNIYINQLSDYYMTLNLGDKEMARLFEVIHMMNARILRSVSHYMGELKIAHEDLNFSMKNFARETLDFETGDDSSYTNMLTDLEWLGVKNAGIFMLKESVIHERDDDFEIPKALLLKAGIRNGELSVRKSVDQLILVKDIFSEEFIDANNNYAVVLLPLYFNEIIYGYFMCDITEAVFSDGDFIVAQLSSAARVIDLLNRFEDLSKKDKLTGLMNRRGFEADAKELYDYSKKNDINMIALYIDMNSLKVINDKFGHEGGDFALSTIGEVLKNTLESRGVVGRIGGDEFVALITVRQDTKCETIERMIYRAFERFNKTCDKPYKVMVSIGSFFVENDDNISFDAAMKKADERMYIAKQTKESVLK